MSAWIVVGDDDLGELLETIAAEAGLTVTALPTDVATARLARGDVPEAMLVTRIVASEAMRPESLSLVKRVAIASADGTDGIGLDGNAFLPLPASLLDVERTLRWVAGDGAQSRRSVSREPSSLRASSS